MNKLKAISYPALIAFGYFILIMFGTVFLLMPFASRDGVSAGFVDAFFTATSASCVTGLVIADTFAKWTLFGQIIILILIQIGGLGFMTIVIMLSMFLGQKIGLTARSLMCESINTMHLGGIVRLTKRIMKGTLIFEGAGAVILTLRFMSDMDFPNALFCGIWHSVSAFCNAGFDIMGRFGDNVSLAPYVGDITVNLTIMVLIVVGGLGFFVWDDLCEKKFRFKKYSLHTKIVLCMTAFLIFVPAVLFFFSESGAAYEGLNARERVLASFFSSVSPRTAGFSTTDVAALSPVGELLTTALMFIGGSPGSTAGGIKTTTIAVMIFSVISGARNRSVTNIFGRRLENNDFRRASSVIVINMTLALLMGGIISAFEPMLELQEVLFETFSAIGTVGLTRGITHMLSPISRVLVALLMYCGRVGSLSFAIIFTGSRARPSVVFPVERVNIG